MRDIEHIHFLIRKRLGSLADLRTYSDDSELGRDLRLNGIDLWSIACDIEEEWNFMFSDHETETWQTVGDIVSAVVRARIDWGLENVGVAG